MKNDYGNTPLHSAIENNNNTTINLLLEDLLTQQKIRSTQNEKLLWKYTSSLGY